MNVDITAILIQLSVNVQLQIVVFIHARCAFYYYAKIIPLSPERCTFITTTLHSRKQKHEHKHSIQNLKYVAYASIVFKC